MIPEDAVVSTGHFTLAPGSAEFLKQLRVSARDAPEAWNNEAQESFVNMVFMSAAEVALLRSVDDAGGVRPPVSIQRRDLIGGLLLWDTADGAGCDTPINIARRQFCPGAVFLFTGDLMKLAKFKPRPALIESLTDLKGFESIIETMHADIERSGRAALLEQARATGYFKMRQLLLRTKAHLLTEKDEATITAEFGDTVKRLSLH